LGRGEKVAPLGALRGIPFFRYIFTNHGQDLSTSLTLFHPVGMLFKEKEQLYIGDFCPFAPPAKEVLQLRVPPSGHFS
jgi:hypothetical protein